MAESQISQTGTFVFKNSQLDAKCFDLALLTDSADEAAFLLLVQDAGFGHENMQRAEIWLVGAKARLAAAKSCKDVFDSQKKRQGECFGY